MHLLLALPPLRPRPARPGQVPEAGGRAGVGAVGRDRACGLGRGLCRGQQPPSARPPGRGAVCREAARPRSATPPSQPPAPPSQRQGPQRQGALLPAAGTRGPGAEVLSPHSLQTAVGRAREGERGERRRRRRGRRRERRGEGERERERGEEEEEGEERGKVEESRRRKLWEGVDAGGPRDCVGGQGS